MHQLLLYLLTLTLTAATSIGALVGEHPESLVECAEWQEGWANLVNQPSRVHGSFVDRTDQFYFAGDTAACNDFLNQYAQLSKRFELVTLAAGPAKVARQLTDETVSYDWELTITGGTHIHLRISPGGSVNLSDLVVPVTLEVQKSSALESVSLDGSLEVEAELEQFVRAHEEKRRRASAAGSE